METEREVVFTVHLTAGDRQCVLALPASDEGLANAKNTLDITEFWEMEVVSLECGIPCLKDSLPTDCGSAVEADKLALEIEGMMQTDGSVKRYAAALQMEKVSSFHEALEIAYRMNGDAQEMWQGEELTTPEFIKIHEVDYDPQDMTIGGIR